MYQVQAADADPHTPPKQKEMYAIPGDVDVRLSVYPSIPASAVYAVQCLAM